MDWINDRYEQMRRRSKHLPEYDFASKEDPKLWMNRLGSKNTIIQQATIRNLDIDKNMEAKQQRNSKSAD